MRRFPAPLLSALLVLALALSGCSGGGGDASTESPTREGGAAGGADAGGSGGAEPGGAPDQSSGEAPPSQDGTGAGLLSARVAPGSALIRTADLSIRVDDVRAAADQAGRIAVSAGGTVRGEERSSGGKDGSAVVDLRVPPAGFDAVLGRLAGLGEEEQRQVGTQDVTDQVVDLDSRIATQKASVARVRALLDRANDLGDVVQIEGELSKRTADLESLQARLAALEEQVDLATITVRLHSSDEASGAAPPPGFRDGLSAGWEAIVVAARLVGVAAGALLPFTPLLLLGALWVHRSRGRRTVGA